MKKLILNLAILTSITNPAHAIGIDALIKVAEDGEAVFTVSNGDGYRQFISAVISDVAVENGQLKTIPYTRENLADWSLEVKPSRTVLDDNATKTFKVISSKVNQEHDHVYQVTFVPTPYFENGERPQHAVQMAVGFAPIMIVPAKEDKPIRYDIRHNGDKVNITNLGQTYLNIVLDGCSDSTPMAERSSCSKVVYALPNRDLVVNLDGEMLKKPSLEMSLMTHNNDFNTKFELEKNTHHAK